MLHFSLDPDPHWIKNHQIHIQCVRIRITGIQSNFLLWQFSYLPYPTELPALQVKQKKNILGPDTVLQSL